MSQNAAPYYGEPLSEDRNFDHLLFSQKYEDFDLSFAAFSKEFFDQIDEGDLGRKSANPVVDTPNSSISSSSTEALGEDDTGTTRKALGEMCRADERDDGSDKPKKL